MRKYPTKTCADCDNKIWEGGKTCVPCFIKSRIEPPQKRFWKHVKKTPTCWLWTGYCSKDGYGIFGLGNKTNVKAHRYSWIIKKGFIRKGKNILHHCDNPPCVRPKHLFEGTQALNVQDCIFKNRQYHILSSKNVKEIRDLYRPRIMSFSRLANIYEVCLQTISNVVSGKTWKHIR